MEVINVRRRLLSYSLEEAASSSVYIYVHFTGLNPIVEQQEIKKEQKCTHRNTQVYYGSQQKRELHPRAIVDFHYVIVSFLYEFFLLTCDILLIGNFFFTYKLIYNLKS